jgi:hypothetical protein
MVIEHKKEEKSSGKIKKFLTAEISLQQAAGYSGCYGNNNEFRMTRKRIKSQRTGRKNALKRQSKTLFFHMAYSVHNEGISSFIQIPEIIPVCLLL